MFDGGGGNMKYLGGQEKKKISLWHLRVYLIFFFYYYYYTNHVPPGGVSA